MTDERPDQTPEETVQTPRREASVTLRKQVADVGDESEMFDPANQSAADALRISYHLLLIGIGALVALFFLSGFKTVDEGRVGIRLTAGAITGRNLQPGIHWSWPQPLGEILTYYRNPPAIAVRDAFYPRVGRDPGESLETLAGRSGRELDPRADGSLITGDQNLVHAQWVVQYRRDDIDDFAQNINPDHEEQIVRMAVQRGAVLAVSQASLDDVIKPGGETSTLVAERARINAQQMLDDLESGLRIDVLDLQRATVPLGIYQEWSQMAGQDAVAAQTIDEARSAARETLNEVAGAAAGALIDLIDEYERAVELGEAERQEELLATIYDIIEGKEVMIDGRPIRVSGEVARVIEMARQYKATVSDRERIRLAKFRSIKEQFDSNPTVVVHRVWSDAYREFRAKPYVQMVQVPPEANVIELLLNEDPEIVRQMRTELRQRRADEAQRQRLDQSNQRRLTPEVKRILEAEPGGN